MADHRFKSDRRFTEAAAAYNPEAGERQFFHGTTSKHLDSIMQKGLLEEPPERGWGLGHIARGRGPYLSTDWETATAAAVDQAEKTKYFPVVVELVADPSKLVSDETHLWGTVDDALRASDQDPTAAIEAWITDQYPDKSDQWKSRVRKVALPYFDALVKYGWDTDQEKRASIPLLQFLRGSFPSSDPNDTEVDGRYEGSIGFKGFPRITAVYAFDPEPPDFKTYVVYGDPVSLADYMTFVGSMEELGTPTGYDPSFDRGTHQFKTFESVDRDGEATKMLTRYSEEPTNIWLYSDMPVRDRVAWAYLAADRFMGVHDEDLVERFVKTLQQVVDDPETFWQQIEEKDPKRAEYLRRLDWDIATVPLNDIGVYPRFSGFSDEVCKGTVLETAAQIELTGELPEKVEKLRDMADVWVTVMKFLPPIIVPGNVLRDRPGYEPTKWACDDGNHRLVSAAMAGAEEAVCFVGRPKVQESTDRRFRPAVLESQDPLIGGFIRQKEAGLDRIKVEYADGEVWHYYVPTGIYDRVKKWKNKHALANHLESKAKKAYKEEDSGYPHLESVNESKDPPLIIVHAGSACGSADMNIGRYEARASREGLMATIRNWNGPMVRIAGMLDDELIDSQELAELASIPAVGERDEPNEDTLKRDAKTAAQALGLKRGQEVYVTGAWDDENGCVNDVVRALKRMGYKAYIDDSAVAMGDWDETGEFQRWDYDPSQWAESTKQADRRFRVIEALALDNEGWLDSKSGEYHEARGGRHDEVAKKVSGLNSAYDAYEWMLNNGFVRVTADGISLSPNAASLRSVQEFLWSPKVRIYKDVDETEPAMWVDLVIERGSSLNSSSEVTLEDFMGLSSWEEVKLKDQWRGQRESVKADRRFRVIELAEPVPSNQEMDFYHATSKESEGKSILKSGIINVSNPKRPRRQLAPRSGYAYISPSVKTAAIYSLGGVMMGHDIPERWFETDGRYGYIFEIPGTELVDVDPDEDNVGGYLHDLLRDDQQYHWLVNMARRVLSPSTLQKVKSGEYAYWASAGKQLLRKMTDEQKQELMDYLSGTTNLAHKGNLKWSRAWRVDKARSKELDENGENLFDVAELIADRSVTESVDTTKQLAAKGFRRAKPVGKRVGPYIYVHRHHEDQVVPAELLAKVRELLGIENPEMFGKYNALKYNTKTGDVTFQHSPDFDTADEPQVGQSVLVKSNGDVKTMEPHEDPQIWHHKWMWVDDDYGGFDVEAAKKRSLQWLPHVKKGESSKIGSKKYWDSIQPRWKKIGEAEGKGELTPEQEQKILDFVKSHENLDDSDFHDFVEKMGVDPHEAEEVVYRYVRERESVTERTELTPDEVAATNATCRTGSGGSSWAQKSKVHDFFREHYTPDTAGHVLDFGAGNPPTHGQALVDDGYTVDFHEHGDNFDPEVHNPDALTTQYDVVLASKVINVQPNPEALDITLGEIRGCTKDDGVAIMNYPEPHKVMKGSSAMSPEDVKEAIEKHFAAVEYVDGTSSNPIFVAMPTEAAMDSPAVTEQVDEVTYEVFTAPEGQSYAGDVFAIAKYQGKKIGYARIEMPVDGTTGEMFREVDEEWRRKGIGSELARRASRAAWKRGVRELIVNVTSKASLGSAAKALGKPIGYSGMMKDLPSKGYYGSEDEPMTSIGVSWNLNDIEESVQVDRRFRIDEDVTSGATVVYRGTQTGAAGRTARRIPSWSPSLITAMVYAARPGDVWSSSKTNRRARHVGESTIHAAEIRCNKALDLRKWGVYCHVSDIMKVLGWPDQMSSDEVIELYTYLHNRLIGRARGGEFKYKTFDEYGDDLELDVPLSFDNPESEISMMRDNFEYEQTLEEASRLAADIYVFMDAPILQKVARRQGYDCLIYQDLFEGARYSIEDLFGLDHEALENAGVLDTETDMDVEDVYTNVTYRPLDRSAIKPLWSRPVADIVEQWREAILSRLDESVDRRFRQPLDESFSTKRDQFIQAGADSAEVRATFDAFRELKNRNILVGKEKDIDQYKTLKQVIDIVKKYSGATSKSQQKREQKQAGAQKVYADRNYTIYRIDTGEASCLYGKGTKWCITGSSGRSTFKDYKRQGYTFYFAIPKPGMMDYHGADLEKYAIAMPPPEHGYDIEIFDEVDNRVHRMPKELIPAKKKKIFKWVPPPAPDISKASAEELVVYVETMLKSKRWPEAEPKIMRSPEWATEYANAVLGKRWPEAEKYIARDPEWAVEYASNFKVRLPAAEPKILNNAEKRRTAVLAISYARDVIGGRWPEAEKIILNSGDDSYAYAVGVIHGPFPEGEPVIARSGRMWSYVNFLRDKSEQFRKGSKNRKFFLDSIERIQSLRPDLSKANKIQIMLYADMTIREIAKGLHLPVKTVRKIIYDYRINVPGVDESARFDRRFRIIEAESFDQYGVWILPDNQVVKVPPRRHHPQVVTDVYRSTLPPDALVAFDEAGELDVYDMIRNPDHRREEMTKWINAGLDGADFIYFAGWKDLENSNATDFGIDNGWIRITAFRYPGWSGGAIMARDFPSSKAWDIAQEVWSSMPKPPTAIGYEIGPPDDPTHNGFIPFDEAVTMTVGQFRKKVSTPKRIKVESSSEDTSVDRRFRQSRGA